MKRIVLILLSSAIAAVALGQHHVEYGMNLSLGNVYIEDYRQGEQGTGPIINESDQPGYGRVAGVANVGFGVNKARVDLSGTNPENPLYFEYGFSTSRYWDSFQFDDPNLTGTMGSFDATLYVEGLGHVNLSPEYETDVDVEFDAFWHAVINVMVDGITDPNGSPIQSAYYAGDWSKAMGETSMNYTGDPLNTYQQTVTFYFIYGQPILMDTFLQVDIGIDNQYANANGTMDTVVDLGNSSYWGGITNLRDEHGNPVNGAGYWSSSGFDYRSSAVPEPATWLAMGIGAITLFLRRRGK